MTRIAALKVWKCSWDTKEAYQDSRWTMAEDMEAAGSPAGRVMDIDIAQCSIRGHLQLNLNEAHLGVRNVKRTLPLMKGLWVQHQIGKFFQNAFCDRISKIMLPLAFKFRKYRQNKASAKFSPYACPFRGDKEDKGGVRGENGSWGSDDCTFFNLRDKIMKFEETVQKRVNHRGQSDFPPGGTHGVIFTTIVVFGLIQILKKQ